MKNSNSKQRAGSNVIHTWKQYNENNVGETTKKILGQVASSLEKIEHPAF